MSKGLNFEQTTKLTNYSVFQVGQEVHCRNLGGRQFQGPALPISAARCRHYRTQKNMTRGAWALCGGPTLDLRERAKLTTENVSCLDAQL